MKKILIFLINLFLATPVFAQFEIGINAGLVKNNVAILYGPIPAHTERISSVRSVISLKGMYSLKQWQFGIKATFPYQQEKYSVIEMRGIGCFGYGLVTSTYAERLLPCALLISRKFNFHKVEAYCGLNVGFVKVYSNGKHVLQDNSSETYNQNSSGYTTGAHAGVTWYVYKNLGFNAEVAANYMKTNTSYFSYDPLTIPMSVGIRYKFGK